MAGIFARFRVRAITFGAAVLVLAGCGQNATPTTSGASSTDVTVWVAWGGNELKAYKDVIKPFEAKTGIKVHYLTIRDQSTQLSINVSAGTSLPDIANAPTNDKVVDWATKGVMKPLESFLDMNSYTANTYSALTTPPAGQTTDTYIYIVNGKHYAEMVKTQVKGLIWYNKKVFTGTPPKTFDEMVAIQPSQYGAQKLFCAGLDSGEASGWPASDQIDNIIMRQSGEKIYLDWIAGKVKWTDPAIKLGYQSLGKELSAANVYGGPSTAISTAFQRAGKPLFATPPGCLFLEQATFISNFFLEDYPSLKAGTDFDFFAHPSVNPQYDGNVNGFYDNFAMYNDTPAARKLMQYMASVDAQQIWANDGGTLAAIKSLTYTDPVFKRAADIAGSAKNLLVTAGDYMPSDMQHAFWKSLLDFTKDQSKLDSILQHLDQVQQAAYSS